MPFLRIAEETFLRLRYDRKTERYRRAIELARLVLLRYHPDLTHGSHHALALLFDMNQIWERFVHQRLLRSSLRHSYRIHYQASAAFWETKKIRPDLYLERRETSLNGLPNLILDAKWKAMKSPLPDDSDLKQMYAYHYFFNASRSVLIYPQTDARLIGIQGKFKDAAKNTPFECQTYFLPVLAGDRLNPDLVSELAVRLQKQEPLGAFNPLSFFLPADFPT